MFTCFHVNISDALFCFLKPVRISNTQRVSISLPQSRVKRNIDANCSKRGELCSTKLNSCEDVRLELDQVNILRPSCCIL